jgi:hypothetical protein
MNSNLVPTAIVDKNGKNTVVHKSLAGSKPASKTLAGAAPTLGGSTKKRAKKPFTPTKKQVVTNTTFPKIYASMLDPKLIEVVEAKYGRGLNKVWQPPVKVTDVEGYGVISAVDSHQHALALMAMGIKTADDAHEFLSEHDLEHLTYEGYPLAQEAMERRIPLESFIDFEVNGAGPDELAPDVYLDTAEAFSHKPLRDVQEIILGVRAGTIKLQDVKDVGITTISKAETKYQLHELLEGINAGTRNYTAKQLGSVLGKCNEGVMEYTMIRMLQQYGGDVADSIKHPNVVRNMHSEGRKDKLSEDEMQAAAVYGDKFMQQAYMHYTFVYEMFRAGVDVDFAANAAKENPQLTSHEIIGLSKGAAAPLIDGWL